MNESIWWFRCTDETSKISVTFESDGTIEQMQDNFVKAVAEAESKTNLTIIVNEEGRRRIDTEKLISAIADKDNNV